MRVRVVFLALSCFAFGLVQACGDDTTTPPDGSADVTVTDTGTTQDTGTQDTGTTDGGGPTGLTFVCDVDGGTVTSCAQCTGFPQECVYCDQADASSFAGHCLAANQPCNGGAPNNFGACGCGTDAGNCPESFQVCRAQQCRTCGESGNTDGLTCKNGGTCNANDGGCN